MLLKAVEATITASEGFMISETIDGEQKQLNKIQEILCEIVDFA